MKSNLYFNLQFTNGKTSHVGSLISHYIAIMYMYYSGLPSKRLLYDSLKPMSHKRNNKEVEVKLNRSGYLSIFFTISDESTWYSKMFLFLPPNFVFSEI